MNSQLYKLIRQVLISVFLFVHLATACSSFFIFHDNQAVFGKNYDWDLGSGLLIVNKRNVIKTALAQNNPVKWKSKYGSVTFNQYGREFPTGGMNEAGLTIEVLWLGETVFSSPDSRYEIDNMQWVQYQLDISGTVDEVLASDTLIRVAPLSEASIHYLVCDKTGNCAGIEFLNGKRVCHSGNDMISKVITNSTYTESIDFLKNHKGFGGMRPIPSGTGSLDRFVYISHMIQKYNRDKSPDIIKYGFNILSNVAMGDYTKWSIIYDVKNLRIHFKTLDNKKTKYIKLTSLDFSCETPVKTVDINIKSSGNINSKLINYTNRINKQLIKSTFKKTDFLADIPKDLLDKVMEYPASLICE
jgi:choloylglycine hydrolase